MPRGVAQIDEQRLQRVLPTVFAHLLRDALHAANLQPCSARRVVRRESTRDVCGGGLLEIVPDLVLDLLVGLRTCQRVKAALSWRQIDTRSTLCLEQPGHGRDPTTPVRGLDSELLPARPGERVILRAP